MNGPAFVAFNTSQTPPLAFASFAVLVVAPLRVTGMVSASIVTVGGGGFVGVKQNSSAEMVKLLDEAFLPVAVSRIVCVPAVLNVTLPKVVFVKTDGDA